jgi:phytanoyl-CoA hydroxylase
VQFFLTDLSQEDSGNFVIVPGSHRRQVSETLPGCFIPEANRYLDEGTLPPGAKQVLAEPGDSVVFHHSLWHAVAPNRSGRERKSIIFRYGHLWHRPFDFDTVSSDILKQLSPRQRRLLGDIGPDPGPKDYYKPAGQLELMDGRSAG